MTAQTKHKKLFGTRSCLYFDIIRKLAHCVQKVADPCCRVQNLKQFCAQLEAQYIALPTHMPTRWTTLGNVLEKMIELWEPLTQHFLSLRCPPRILENFFRSEESLVIVSFLHSALSVFKKPPLLLQSTSALFLELADIFETFKTAIFQRRNSEFYGAKTDELLKGIDSDCAEVRK